MSTIFLLCVQLVKILKVIYSFISGKKIWIFTSWEAQIYSDNPKYLFEYVYNHKRRYVKPIWITVNEELYKEMKRNKIPVFLVNKKSREIFISLIADVYFFSDIEYPLKKRHNPKLKYVNLWHGMPIKQIGDLSGSIKQDYFIASNPSSREILATATGLSKDKVLLIGQPKNDGLFTSKSLHKHLGINEQSYLILYMPTYRGSFESSAMNRDNESGVLLENNEQTISFNDLLEKENAYFIIKPHLRNKMNTNLGSRFIILDDFSDLVPKLDNYEILGNVDMLISDYSSIILDFYATQKPMLFYTPDFRDYNITQKLNYDYSKITMGEHIFDQQALYERIGFYLKNRSFLPEDYNQLKQFFNTFNDNKNAQRAYQTFYDAK
jgi:CDP-glycerol glycerophosphotransferase (TagB/SpsB family)